ncbi:hypothetical protein [Dyadobacter arcticus]|uniref:CHASE2 domain-containing sensor protein n=1 Tax=Dyadobacter arcticus TaxID=1078754 RepID=A0ABX0UM13_9BACT|nr:hypothetical protein [Dyadobacter arcticus]NIJ52490.1 CHASE2 domain-containing sensor protein [Dyadobacter arcticus]
MLRQIIAVIGGYTVFVVSSLLLFRVSGVKPHGDASTSFMILTALYGLLFSLVGGIVTQLVAGRKSMTVNYALALITAGFATFSYFKATGSHWTQLLAIFVFAPISVKGGWIYFNRKLK